MDYKNIRALLIEGFTAEELRRFCFDNEDFRPVYNELAPEIGKGKIIDSILEHADHKLKREVLLDWAKNQNPAMYEKYQSSRGLGSRDLDGKSLDDFFYWLDLPVYYDQNPQQGRSQIVGRDADIKKISGLLRSNELHAPRMIVLEGRAGVGKTTVGWAVCYDFEDNLNQKDDKESFSLVIAHKILSNERQTFDDFITKIAYYLKLDAKKTIEERKLEVQNELRRTGLRVLFFLDGMPSSSDTPGKDIQSAEKLTSLFLNFLRTLPRSTRTLITAQVWDKPSRDISVVDIEGLNENYIDEFLREYGCNAQLSEKAIKRIYEKTDGNTVPLQTIARETDLTPEHLEELLKVITDPKGDIAEQWIGASYKGLDNTAKQILKAHTLFEQRTTHLYTLADTIFYFNASVSSYSDDKIENNKNEEKKHAHRREIQQALERLVNRVFRRKPDEKDRYFVSDPWFQYVRKMVVQDDELTKWKQAQILAYAHLRPSRNREEAGWTIFTDYRPDDNEAPDYAHEDEVKTILQIIEYCAADDKAPIIWEYAAVILDDFRAALFASGNWEHRIKYCKRVKEYFESSDKKPHIAARTARLLAWVYCFRDEFNESTENAIYAKKKASQGVRDKRSTQEMRITFRQSYYKALVTLGQIALRQGVESVIETHKKIESDKDGGADYEEARILFRLARWRFLQARGFVGAEYPLETYIMDFYLAEVDFYDRNPSKFTNQTNRPRDMLLRAYRAFTRILSYAIAWPPANEISIEDLPLDQMEELEISQTLSNIKSTLAATPWNDQPKEGHQRLTAYVLYYLGKSSRRLARPESSPENPEHLLIEARLCLELALDMARLYHDHILLARVKFALGQWYEQESKIDKTTTEKIASLTIASTFINEASDVLRSSGMKAGSEDAERFFRNRIEAELEKLQGNNPAS